ncbi:MAG: hypothetical protein A3C36_00505 [Omnitrophica WOR_2 bacterium RIFCSPHIGHO2_02_FULL_52_10]|nr:MAG: hypothetical protein A3C36_00505 [Omnitrophica WOR_2 bacterium RIFCSPHIGHO2_02_FULL_52_10]
MKTKAFTLMELVVVIILVSIVAAFAIPSYVSGIRKVRERDMNAQLRVIHAAVQFYRSQVGQYPAQASGDLNYINQTFRLTLPAITRYVYRYSSTDPTLFEAGIRWNDPGGTSLFDLEMNQGPASAANPCCNAGSIACPSVPAC